MFAHYASIARALSPARASEGASPSLRAAFPSLVLCQLRKSGWPEVVGWRSVSGGQPMLTMQTRVCFRSRSVPMRSQTED